MFLILDYDDTFTRDPEFWLGFIDSVLERGHAIICCTLRTEEEAKRIDKKLLRRLTVVATGRQAKHKFLSAAGYDMLHAVWIDDMPHFIHLDAAS